MATKTIDVDLDVYERLVLLSGQAKASFSDILRRDLPSPSGWSGRDILEAIEAGTFPHIRLTDEDEAEFASVRASLVPGHDPWTR